MQIIKLSKYWLFIIAGIVLIPLVIIYAAQSYRSDSGTTITVNEHGTCKRVVNSGSNSYFIPTNTAGEWESFRNAVPGLSNVSLTGCYVVRENLETNKSCDTICGEFNGVCISVGLNVTGDDTRVNAIFRTPTNPQTYDCKDASGTGGLCSDVIRTGKCGYFGLVKYYTKCRCMSK